MPQSTALERSERHSLNTIDFGLHQRFSASALLGIFYIVECEISQSLNALLFDILFFPFSMVFFPFLLFSLEFDTSG